MRIAGYGNNRTANQMGQDGLSYQTAVGVSSVEDEYKWLNTYYLGFGLIEQGVCIHQGKAFDMLAIFPMDVSRRSIARWDDDHQKRKQLTMTLPQTPSQHTPTTRLKREPERFTLPDTSTMIWVCHLINGLEFIKHAPGLE